MDFAQTANANGPSDPLNLVLRGADPLYSLPAGHLVRRSGIILCPTPGALVATLDNVKASEVEAAVFPALRPDAGLAATRASQCGNFHGGQQQFGRESQVRFGGNDRRRC